MGMIQRAHPSLFSVLCRQWNGLFGMADAADDTIAIGILRFDLWRALDELRYTLADCDVAHSTG